jgi:hypothetical protein
MEHAHHHHVVRRRAIEENMDARGISPIARTQMITRLSSGGIASNDFDRPMQPKNITVSLIIAPFVGGEIPNPSQILSGSRGKNITAHFD